MPSATLRQWTYKLYNCEFLDPCHEPREVHLLHGSMIFNYLSLAHIYHSLKAFLARNQFEYKAIVTEAFNVGRKS